MITTRDEVKLIIALLLSRDSVLHTGMMLIEKKRLFVDDDVDVVDVAFTFFVDKNQFLTAYL